MADQVNRTAPAKAHGTKSAIDVDLNDNFVDNRGFTDDLVLPYDFDSVKIKPNEFVTSDNINAALYKLYNNFLFLNSRCKLASSDVPTKLISTLSSPQHKVISLSGSYGISNHGSQTLLFDGTPNPTLKLVRGGTYIFNNVTTGFTFRISDTHEGSAYNNAEAGPDKSVTFTVPYDAPDKLYYYSSDPLTDGMNGGIEILDYYPPWLVKSSICAEADDIPEDLFKQVVVYDQCPDLKIPDKIIPSTSLSGVENLQWSTDYKTNYFCEDNNLSDVRNMVAIDTIYVYGDYYLLFASTKNHLLAMEAKFDNRVNVVMGYTNKVEDVNDIVFEDISSIAINSNNILYVADQQQNMVYQYNIENFTTNNPVMRARGKILLKSIGGKGTASDRERFNSPIKVRIGANNKVYILDDKNRTGNKCVKVYDENLNWLETITKRVDWSNEDIVDILVDTKTEEWYSLSSKGILFCYDKDNTLTKKYDLNSDYIGTKKPTSYKELNFSKEEPNILYVLTSDGVIKKWKTKLQSKIGFYDFKKFGITDVHLRSFCLYQGTFAPLYTLFFATRSVLTKKCGRILRMEDKNDFVTLIYDDYKKLAYSFDSIGVAAEEFVTHIVLNKAFLKLMYNHSLFKDHLHSLYSGIYDSNGEGHFTGLRYLQGERAKIYNHEFDSINLVGVNEIVMSEVVNRPLYEIYKFQQKLLDAIQPEYLNFYPVETAPIHLR